MPRRRLSTASAPPLLLGLTRRRWALPILAELHRAESTSGWAGGAKLVTLCHRLDANQVAIRQSLDHLIALGLVARNSGHGHPLRPEYILTRRGESLAPRCAAVDDRLVQLRLRDLGLRRWSLPVVQAVDHLEDARFTHIAESLHGVTARALALSLKGLCGERVMHREVVDTFPVSTSYTLAAAGRSLAPLVARLV